MRLLTDQSTDTDDTQGVHRCNGGGMLIQTDGEFGGATVTIQGSMEGFDFQDLLDATGEVVAITEPTTKFIDGALVGFKVRASLTGASGTTSVSVGMLV